jgi:UPF0288 family protein (methanogenesis marker protein 3)
LRGDLIWLSVSPSARWLRRMQRIITSELLRLNSTVIEDGRAVLSVRGKSRASKPLVANNVTCCEVEASSHKVGDLTKKKMKVIGRRSESEN